MLPVSPEYDISVIACLKLTEEGELSERQERDAERDGEVDELLGGALQRQRQHRHVGIEAQKVHHLQNRDEADEGDQENERFVPGCHPLHVYELSCEVTRRKVSAMCLFMFTNPCEV